MAQFSSFLYLQYTLAELRLKLLEFARKTNSETLTTSEYLEQEDVESTNQLLTDEEIVALVRHEQTEDEPVVETQEPVVEPVKPAVTFASASASFDTLSEFFENSVEFDQADLRSLRHLKQKLEYLKSLSTVQTKITDFTI